MSGPRRVIAGAAGQHLSQGSYGATNTCGDAAREKTVGEGRSAGGGGLAFLCSMPWLIEGRSSVRGRVASREFNPPGTRVSDIFARGYGRDMAHILAVSCTHQPGYLAIPSPARLGGNSGETPSLPLWELSSARSRARVRWQSPRPQKLLHAPVTSPHHSTFSPRAESLSGTHAENISSRGLTRTLNHS